MSREEVWYPTDGCGADAGSVTGFDPPWAIGDGTELVTVGVLAGRLGRGTVLGLIGEVRGPRGPATPEASGVAVEFEEVVDPSRCVGFERSVSHVGTACTPTGEGCGGSVDVPTTAAAGGPAALTSHDGAPVAAGVSAAVTGAGTAAVVTAGGGCGTGDSVAVPTRDGGDDIVDPVVCCIGGTRDGAGAATVGTGGRSAGPVNLSGEGARGASECHKPGSAPTAGGGAAPCSCNRCSCCCCACSVLRSCSRSTFNARNSPSKSCIWRTRLLFAYSRCRLALYSMRVATSGMAGTPATAFGTRSWVREGLLAAPGRLPLAGGVAGGESA